MIFVHRFIQLNFSVCPGPSPMVHSFSLILLEKPLHSQMQYINKRNNITANIDVCQKIELHVASQCYVIPVYMLIFAYIAH